VVNNLTGEIGIDVYGSMPILARTGGSLVTLTMHVREDAPAGASGLNLVSQVNPTGNAPYHTMASDNQGQFTLHPAVTDAGTDHGVDGQVTVPVQQTSGMQSLFALPMAVSATSTATISNVLQGQFAFKGSDVSLGLLEQVFGDFEQLMVQETAFVQPAPVFSSKLSNQSTTELSELDPALAPTGAGQPDWMSDDFVAYLGRAARRTSIGELGDDLLEESDLAGLEAFFAREAAKRGG